MKRMVTAWAALALGGCGGETTTEQAARTCEVSLRNASIAEVAEQTAATGEAMRFQPGEWETKVEVVNAEIPGVPPAMAEQMRKAMTINTSVTDCMTPEQAERPSEGLFARDQGECRFDRYDMRGGRIDGAMTCTSAGEGTARITMQGSYTPTSFEMRNTVDASRGGGQAMKMESRVTGRRLGECRS
jgi:hypothetical protein